MNKSCLIAVAFTFMLAPSLATYAALVELEWDKGTPANTDLTLDSYTGFVWLDLTITEGQSYAEVLQATHVGGAYEGFRYATTDEVRSLFNYVTTLELLKPPSNTELIRMEELQSKTGITSGSLGSNSSQLGITALDDPDHPEVQMIAVTALYFHNVVTELLLDAAHSSVVDTARNTDIGSYLIQVTAVPIPPSVWLFGSGLLGLIGIARRKKA